MFYLNGKLQQNTNGLWSINGIAIRVSNQSQLFTPLSDGVVVNATAIRLNTLEYLILVLSADDSERKEPNAVEDMNNSTDFLSDSNRGTSSDDDGEQITEDLLLSTAVATMTLQETEPSDDDEIEQTPSVTSIPTITPDETEIDVDDTPETDDDVEDTPTFSETPEPTDTPEEDN
jgi:hypothetical protein